MLIECTWNLCTKHQHRAIMGGVVQDMLLYRRSIGRCRGEESMASHTFEKMKAIQKLLHLRMYLHTCRTLMCYPCFMLAAFAMYDRMIVLQLVPQNKGCCCACKKLGIYFRKSQSGTRANVLAVRRTAVASLSLIGMRPPRTEMYISYESSQDLVTRISSSLTINRRRAVRWEHACIILYLVVDVQVR